MSRVGKNPIFIPEKTEVAIENGTITVRGPQGELSREYRDSEVSITVEETEQGKAVQVSPLKDHIFARALWGTYASHIRNMLQGVNQPFVKKLVIEGVGFRAEVSGSSLVLNIGFSHPVTMPIPEGVTVSVEKGEITISGINKEEVASFAARIRAMKKPEPYKGKGIRYADEVVRRKQGKKAV